jgi:hypothetical protein
MLESMKRRILLALSVCLIAVVISGTTAASAATATNLPAGILIGDQDGIHVDAHGYYYIDVRGLKPGDVIHKTITIQNLEQNDTTPEGKVPYTMTMTAEPLLSRGPVDLLDATHLTIKLDGEIIYDGTCRGDGTPNMIQQALALGVYAVGDRRVLDFTLTVDSKMQLFEEKSEADFKWQFYAYRAVAYDAPKTGIMDTYDYLFPIGGTMLLFLALIPLKKRRDERIRAANHV